MFDVFGKLSMESRRAIFSAVLETHGSAAPDVSPELIARSLLRTPSGADVCKRARVDDAALLETLGGNLASVDSTNPFSAAESALGSHGVGIVLPMSGRTQNVMEALAARLAREPFESVAPPRLLRELLICDQELRELCSRFGLTDAAFDGEGL
jgi:hypothetical protein